jgi:hypothetical protein
MSVEQSGVVTDAAFHRRAARYIQRFAAVVWGSLDEEQTRIFRANLIDYINEYVIDGRRFAGLNGKDLKETWIAAFNGLADGDRNQFDDLDDATAELLLRGLEPPIGSVERSYRQRRRQLVSNSRPTVH